MIKKLLLLVGLELRFYKKERIMQDFSKLFVHLSIFRKNLLESEQVELLHYILCSNVR